MGKQQKALILGSGYAAQGHAMALRDCGVEIIGMASRTDAVVQNVAAEMSIPCATTDWRQAIKRLNPDIVSVATTADVHYEMVDAAIDAGCHIYCEKPLAPTADKAKELYRKARSAGVKTAYASTFRYQPTVLLARQLIRSGVIGDVHEVEYVSHPHAWSKLTPFNWHHRLETGGGRLNGNFTHILGVVLSVLGGNVIEATGETRNDLRRVPVAEHIHDARMIQSSALSPEEADEKEWREVNSDWSYTVLARIRQPGMPTNKAISASFRHSYLSAGFHEEYIAFYGSDGTVHWSIPQQYGLGTLWLKLEKDSPGYNVAPHTVPSDDADTQLDPAGPGERSDHSWQEISIPRSILDEQPPIQNHIQRNWTQLAREFVGDITGKSENPSYLTFREGWIFQEIIDIVRARKGWTPVPLDL